MRILPTVLVVQALCAGSAMAVPLDLSGVRNNQPDFIDRTFAGERFDTLVDGSLVSTPPDRLRLRGYANGDLTTGGIAGSTVEYRLDFDRAVDFAVSGVATNGPGPLGQLGRRDLYTISSDVEFILEDEGNDDLRNVTYGEGFVSFSFINRGPDTWTLRSVGATRSFTVSYTNLQPVGRTTRNIGTVNVQAFAIPEPGSLALVGLGLAGMFAARRASVQLSTGSRRG